MTLDDFIAGWPVMAVDDGIYECCDCGFQSDDWPEFCGHSRQWHFKEPKAVAA